MARFEFYPFLILLFSQVQAFAPLSGSRAPSVAAPPLRAIPESFESMQRVVESSNVLLGMDEKMGEFAKSAIIALAFGGGLIPAAIAANKAMIGTLSGTRAGGDDDSDYVSDSGASGPALPGQALLFASENIPLVDIVAVMGRIKDTETMADWRNLPSTASAPNVMWLPRAMFKQNIRKAKFTGWPVDPKTGGKFRYSTLLFFYTAIHAHSLCF